MSEAEFMEDGTDYLEEGCSRQTCDGCLAYDFCLERIHPKKKAKNKRKKTSKSTKICTKYTQKRGNCCTIKCKNGEEIALENSERIVYCPMCGKKLLEIGYGTFPFS